MPQPFRNHTILVVDDDPVQRRLVEATIVRSGNAVIKAENGQQAIDILSGCKNNAGNKPSAVILDLAMPGMDGMAVLETMRQSDMTMPVIIQTASGGIETVVKAMQLGAFDFVVKPVSPDRLLAALAKAVKFEGAVKAIEKPGSKASTGFSFRDIVTEDPLMQPILKMASKAATSNIPVLIEGESGVGKEMFARAIHGASNRATKPLITVNCGALPENLVESILFGHEKGAFTGASEKHRGKFEEAQGGTLFLDEIGELPLELQVKLLRAIQEGEIDPIGASRPVKVDIRLISATNRDLTAEIRAGRFREDLFYRLSVLPVTIPALRKRRRDIAPLVYHFIKRIARSEGKTDISAIHREALALLCEYEWPGNIRELENAIFRAIVLCDGDELGVAEFPQIASQMPDFVLPAAAEVAAPIDFIHDLGKEVDAPSMVTPMDPQYAFENEVPQKSVSPATGSYGMLNLLSGEGQIRPLSEIEAEAIRFAIEAYSGRMSEIARRLGIGRSTLYRKLKDYGFESQDEAAEE
jgi:DNA-binding NtrC family response regulator